MTRQTSVLKRGNSVISKSGDKKEGKEDVSTIAQDTAEYCRDLVCNVRVLVFRAFACLWCCNTHSY